MVSGQHTVRWTELFRRPGFPFFFIGMFISLFGTGMNFAGVSWYVLERTGSTVQVSLVTILVTLPGLIVPPFGGVLIDRVDRRYLGIALDLARGAIVLGAAALAYTGRMHLAHLFTMVLLLGVGFAIYWSTTHALIQEIVPRGALIGANAAVLIAVQGGMMTAGAVVGFIYNRAQLPGILAIDGATYLISALCLWSLRRGYSPPHRTSPPEEPSPTIEAPSPPPAQVAEVEPAIVPPMGEREPLDQFLADIREGLRYLRHQPRVLSLGITYACMMGGVLSGNVLLVALAKDVLHTDARGFGYLEAGWAAGAIAGGLASAWLTRRRPFAALVLALATLALGHALFPYAKFLALAVAMNGLFGLCRALGGVLTQSSIMSTVPRGLMGRTQSAFSVLATLMQVAMSFALGWLAQDVGLSIAFIVLGALYSGATLAALRARSLSHAARKAVASG